MQFTVCRCNAYPDFINDDEFVVVYETERKFTLLNLLQRGQAMAPTHNYYQPMVAPTSSSSLRRCARPSVRPSDVILD
jgi:hypothetical protein